MYFITYYNDALCLCYNVFHGCLYTLLHTVIMPDLSIIIISYNTKEITQTCLDTVVRSVAQDPDISAEIIVLDNASEDGSPAMLKKFKSGLSNHPTITMQTLFSKKNLGFSKGNNQAVQQAKAPILLLLNSDIEVVHDAIPNLLTLYKKHSFDFAGGKLLNKDMSPQPSVGRFYTLPVAFAALFLKADAWGFSRSSPSSIRQVDWISGACIMARKDIYEALGGFDESIFMYWDEVDLLFRARENGYLTGFFPQPRFIHLEGASSKSRTQPILKVFRGYLHFYKKHYSPLHSRVLKYMLQLKSVISIMIGKITGNSYLIDTYKEAYEIAKKD